VTQSRVVGVDNCQLHHILSDKSSFIKDHKLLKAAGFDLNDPVNKMLLPTVEGAMESTTTRTIHQGRHVEAYSKGLAKKMTEIYEIGVKECWTQQKFSIELEKIITKTRADLKAGMFDLNKNTREYHGLPTSGDSK